MDIFNQQKIKRLEKEKSELLDALEWNRSNLKEAEPMQHKSMIMAIDRGNEKEKYSLLLNAYSKLASSIYWNNEILEKYKTT